MSEVKVALFGFEFGMDGGLTRSIGELLDLDPASYWTWIQRACNRICRYERSSGQGSS